MKNGITIGALLLTLIAIAPLLHLFRSYESVTKEPDTSEGQGAIERLENLQKYEQAQLSDRYAKAVSEYNRLYQLEAKKFEERRVALMELYDQYPDLGLSDKELPQLLFNCHDTYVTNPTIEDVMEIEKKLLQLRLRTSNQSSQSTAARAAP